MNSHPTFSELLTVSLSSKYYEPTASTRDRSVREMKLGPHHIRHRFPFRGGVPFGSVLTDHMKRTNPLLEMLSKRGANRGSGKD